MNDDLARLRRTADGSLTLYSARYQQAFASERGALREAEHVFLEGSGVGARLGRGEALRVLEVGLGTGLNFFVTARQQRRSPASALRYTALEQTLLEADIIAPLAYGRLLADEALFEAYLSWRRAQALSKEMAFRYGHVTLELRLGDATAQTLPAQAYDAIYHDAFSPEVNPELWDEAFLGRLVASLKVGGVLVSYCVQGAVRRRLQALGLRVSKRPGPVGGKREVLRAENPNL